MRIAFLQIQPSTLAKAEEACRKAASLSAELAIMPEMYSTGYSFANGEEAMEKDDARILAFSALARSLGMAIALTFLERKGDGILNSLLVFDRHGEEVLHYSKVHTCDFAAERVLERGDGFSVATLDTKDGPVKLGAMICYDREAPESARILMLQGAELIIVPNACPMEINRLSQLRSRAWENMLAIATCNYPSGTADCNGHSTLFDGIAFNTDGSSRDMCLLETGEEEGVFIADLDIERLRLWRKSEVQGNAYRRPKLYGLLCGEEVDEPFRRADARR